MKLWLDDLRDPRDFVGEGWTWVKTVDEAISLLETGSVTEVSLDHDLSLKQTLSDVILENEQTGYDVICWMEERNMYPIGGIRCHSMNPVGRKRINNVIEKLRATNGR